MVSSSVRLSRVLGSNSPSLRCRLRSPPDLYCSRMALCVPGCLDPRPIILADVSGAHNVVAIDPLFPFQLRPVIISHPVISRPSDIFHSLLAQRIPILLETRPAQHHVPSHGPHLPREARTREALGSPFPSAGVSRLKRALLDRSLCQPFDSFTGRLSVRAFAG